MILYAVAGTTLATSNVVDLEPVVILRGFDLSGDTSFDVYKNVKHSCITIECSIGLGQQILGRVSSFIHVGEEILVVQSSIRLTPVRGRSINGNGASIEKKGDRSAGTSATGAVRMETTNVG